MAEDDPDLFCSWQNGLSCNLDTVTNNLKLGEVNKCDIPVPDPLKIFDNDFQRFARTVLLKNQKQQYIQITSAKRGTSTTSSTKQTLWSQYQANPAFVQSEIKFDAPGLYDLETIGIGYNRKAVAYTADTNVVNNPNSDGLCGVPGIDKFAKFKLFYESEKDYSGACFDDAALSTNMVKLKTSPFSNNLQAPFATLETALNAQCTWCCRKTRKLKEQFTPYDCSAYSSQAPSCVGDTGVPSACSIDVCLQAKGVDVATTTIGVKNTIQTASNAVLNSLTSKPVSIDTTKNVYYTIPCTSFDKSNVKCRYTVKLSELLDITTGFVTSFPTPSEAVNSKDYVFWRYNTDGSTFTKWDPLADTAISFLDASTTVVLEAWTACGRVNQFTFGVNLFVQSALTCSKFDSMWKFIEKYGIQGGEGVYCAYEGSDFAILKFDMAVTDVVGQTNSALGVKCDIMVKEAGAADTQIVTLVDDQISTRISKYYGVELVNNPTTAQKTTGVVHCKFTRTVQSYSRTDINSIDCRHSFTITDCDKPELNCEKKENMCSVKCAGDPAPGIFEACGGSIVASSATNTFLKTPTEPSCCNKCNKPLVCTSVSTTDIKRCEPSSNSLLKLEAATMTDSEPTFMNPTNIMLLVATVTLIAVVAVNLKHRVNNIEQGDYYRLL
ncbi:Amino Acid/Auxin Permease (AAAP) Family [Phytophthora nicotianae]|uniref:Amino Acid/Auxin Permease (AAAP) Family n=1 Tax=Phytophthora nicotianae TaxID=4792 RepID=A0A0W8DPL9_PHYNI|nr:Amino Acid/Auxin Permease (AAAP) Family [Phytophthora nicotianae]